MVASWTYRTKKSSFFKPTNSSLNGHHLAIIVKTMRKTMKSQCLERFSCNTSSLAVTVGALFRGDSSGLSHILFLQFLAGHAAGMHAMFNHSQNSSGDILATRKWWSLVWSCMPFGINKWYTWMLFLAASFCPGTNGWEHPCIIGVSPSMEPPTNIEHDPFAISCKKTHKL